ncbi:MAG: toll/interleukin-1 receptor domain-containing protein, partial [Candidatus Lokiarchaeota archaeon]|nr:toll/interleukin-1 receptor domain-containing protein [Candidatus Lokiarchaeota archaeon]
MGRGGAYNNLDDSQSDKIENEKQHIENEIIELPKEQMELINQKVEEILTGSPKEGEFRFLILGDENSQKPLLSKLLRVEKISWPPNTHTILYNTLDYIMKIDVEDYKFQLFFLSNINKLMKNSSLFNNACKKANGIVIFFNHRDPEGFTYVANFAKTLREKDSELEIILTSGYDNIPHLFYELKRLKEENEINNNNDYNKLISELMINTLNRTKERNEEIQYSLQMAINLQEQLYDQKVRRDFMEFMRLKEKSEKGEEIKIAPKNTIFISYSHKDSIWLERVQDVLKSLERGENIIRWDDTRIKAGEEWREEINQSLHSSQVAILLISNNFLASDFIANNELPPLLEAAKTRGTTILSLIISHSRFQKIESLARLQTVNNPDTEQLVKLGKGEQEDILVRLSDAVENAFKNTKF